MSELNKFQLWCKEILPVVQAAAEGAAIEFQSPAGTWRPKLGFEVPVLLAGIQYRIKPKTIVVNGFDVPEPITGSLPELYYMPCLSSVDLYTWDESSLDPVHNLRWRRGICHTTKEAAKAHAKAILGIDPNKD